MRCLFCIFILLILKYIVFLNSDMCISLIIPSNEKDFLRCYKNTFHYFKNYIFAKEIIIVISSVTNISKIKNMFNNFTYKRKLILGIRKSKHNAASNKNYGFKLSKCEIISFFDIDDIMHEYRLPTILNVFRNDITTEVILHKFTQSCIELNKYTNITNYKIKRYNFSYDYIRLSYYNYNKSIYCCKYIYEIKSEKISNGWSSMRRYIFNNLYYNESLDSGEDSDFNGKIVLYGHNLTLLNMTLGYYKKDNSCKLLC